MIQPKAWVVFFVSVLALRGEHASERIRESNEVLLELMGAGDNGIPTELLERAHCAVIIPGAKKGGFFVGAHYGRGFAVCRSSNHRRWGAPAAVRMEGGSIGLQIGAAESDIFLLIMNESGMRKLLDSQFTLDASAGVAAGPVGRSSRAATDAHLRAGILSWSRSRGAFAGLTLGGGTLRQDLDENAELYGRAMTNKQILSGDIKVPASAEPLIATLSKYSRVEEGQRAREKK